jgi:glutathione S-transferase
MKLYSGPLSLFSAKARIALAEKGIAHELEQVRWSRAERYLPHHPEVARLNPKGQVPVLIDGDVVVYDSTLIFEYLEERHPTPPLYPSDRAGRVRCRQQEAAADEIWFPHIWTIIEARFYPDGAPDSPAAQAAEHELAAYFAAFDRALGDRDYYCGPFTVADIGSFIFVNAAASLGIAAAAELTRLHAWHARVAARPAVAAVTQDMNAAAAAAFAA